MRKTHFRPTKDIKDSERCWMLSSWRLLDVKGPTIGTKSTVSWNRSYCEIDRIVKSIRAPKIRATTVTSLDYRRLHSELRRKSVQAVVKMNINIRRSMHEIFSQVTPSKNKNIKNKKNKKNFQLFLEILFHHAKIILLFRFLISKKEYICFREMKSKSTLFYLKNSTCTQKRIRMITLFASPKIRRRLYSARGEDPALRGPKEQRTGVETS